MGDGCGGAETLNVPKGCRPGTGALRQECLMHSRLSAPQAQDVLSFACPGRLPFGALRVSRPAADAPQFPMPPAPLPVLVLAAWGWPRKCSGWWDCLRVLLYVKFIFIGRKE